MVIRFPRWKNNDFVYWFHSKILLFINCIVCPKNNGANSIQFSKRIEKNHIWLDTSRTHHYTQPCSMYFAELISSKSLNEIDCPFIFVWPLMFHSISKSSTLSERQRSVERKTEEEHTQTKELVCFWPGLARHSYTYRQIYKYKTFLTTTDVNWKLYTRNLI